MGADFFAPLLVPRLASRVASMLQGVSLRFLDTARGDVERLLNDDAVDMALELPLNMPEWIASEPLFLSPFKVIAVADNPRLQGLADDAVLPLDIFCALPFEAWVPEIRLYWHSRRTRDPAHAWLRAEVVELCGIFRNSA